MNFITVKNTYLRFITMLCVLTICACTAPGITGKKVSDITPQVTANQVTEVNNRVAGNYVDEANNQASFQLSNDGTFIYLKNKSYVAGKYTTDGNHVTLMVKDGKPLECIIEGGILISNFGHVFIKQKHKVSF